MTLWKNFNFYKNFKSLGKKYDEREKKRREKKEKKGAKGEKINMRKN